MTHTPGKWTWNCRTAHREAEARWEHDARLIAAAPDLLAALRKLVPTNFDDHPQDFMPEWHEARAALAKANGAP